jgi:hypothetical protein
MGHVMQTWGRLSAAVLGMALTVAAVASPTPEPSHAVTAQKPAKKKPAKSAAKLLPMERSGMPWASGVFFSHDVPSHNENFGTWRGAAPDVALTYTFVDTWDEIIRMPRIYQRWSDPPKNLTLVISTGMIPETGATLAECAAGAYDAKWRAFGRGLADRNLASRTVIRLGWEFNGLWVPWAAKKPKEYAACWRRIVDSAEIAAPELLWDWCVNRGMSSVGIDPRQAYPGDRYVDIVGIDSFDGYPPATTEQGWRDQAESKYGLEFWADFARRHGKGFSVPEWAVYPGSAWSGNSGGDNPRYIERMFKFFRENADVLTYEIYFNEFDPYQAGALELNPKAALEYRRQLRHTLRRHACPTCPLPSG